MSLPPTRRRSFITLPPALEEGTRALSTHRSFAGPTRNSLDIGTQQQQPLQQQQQQQQQQREQPRLLTARGVLVAAAIFLLVFVAGSRSCVGSRCAPCSERDGVGLTIHATTNGNAAGLPPDPRYRPYYDLVVAVLAMGGESKEAQEEIARVRKVYARYGSEVVPDGGSGAQPLTFRVVFVVGRAGLPDDQELPEAGLLRGDFYHVDVREGYAHLSDKTKAMAGLAEHLRFRFLAKTDGDTFPCLARVTKQLVDLPGEQQPRVYAGMLNKCGTVFPKGHKLYDPEFLAATGGTIDCHPMYHQGAFYILGVDIVNYLNKSRDMLSVMSVEDAMMGLWLLGVDKVMLDIGGSFYCKCFTHPVPRKKLSFYHFCKTDEKMDACLREFGAC
ncbi:unnamed protein product [Ectocarpus sp. 12 AP-2014]